MASQALLCQQADNSLAPVPLQCRGGFDFSLLFEEAILGILPLGLIVLILPWRIWHLFQKPRKVNPSVLEYVKLSLWICLGVVQLGSTTQWARPSISAWRTDASIAVNAVLTSAFFLLSVLSYAEHNFSTTPSFLLNVYLFVTLLFDIAKTRTLWLRQTGGTSQIICALTTVTVVLKVVLLLVESIEKRSILRNDYKASPPEAIGGLFNKVFFWWLNPLFRLGFSKSLVVNDLYFLDKQLSSKRLHSSLERAYRRASQKDPNTLLLLTIKTFKWPICASIVPRALLVALNFCQPLLLHRSLAFSLEPVNSATNNTGYGLIGAYILVYTGLGLTMGQQQHLTYRAITMIRGAIVSMVYKKACTLNLNDADPAESVTLMSADIERIVTGWQTVHEMWANPAEIALAIYLLERELGVASAVPVGVAIVALVGCMLCMALVAARQAKWLEAIERRISATSAMLGSMKGIKMLGLQSSLMQLVHGLRIDELDISKKFRRLMVWAMAFAWLTRIFAPILALGAFVGIEHNRGQDSALDTTTVFTAMSLFSLLADPLLSLVMALMAFAGAVGSFARIQTFLEKENHVDPREKVLTQPFNPLKLSKYMALIEQSEVPSESSSSQFSKGSMSSLSHHIIEVQHGSFGWDSEKESSVQNVSMTIMSGTFVMLIGPSGCGKSTLFKAILGEVPCQHGSIRLGTESVAYCDQSPWHMNASIRDCITAMSPFDREWYTTVINACALSKDLEQLPRGDETIIGSKGISLSGGQSQRIAIARAVYARKELVMFDDVFSSLDTETENHIFDHLLGDHGLLRSINTTVLFASSSVKRAPFVDHIIVLDKHGYISEQGVFSALDAAGGYISSFNLERVATDSKAGLKQVSETSVKVYTTDKELEAETANYRGAGDISVYLYYIRAIGWAPSIFFTVAITGFIFCLSFPTLWVKWWAASNESHPGERIGYYLGIYAMLGGVGMLSLLAGAWQMIINMVPKSGEAFHRNLLSTVLSAPMLFFSTADSGSILNRFSQDLQLIDMELPIALINTFATFVLCLCQMIFMGIASKYAAISFPFVLLIVYGMQKVYLRTSRQLRFLDLEAKAPLYSHFTDSLSGLASLRAFGWQQSLQEKHYQLLDRSQRPFYLLYAVQRWLTLTLDLVVAGIAVLLIILVVTLRGEISVGYVGVALLNVIMFSQSIKLLVTFWTNLETHIGSILRVKSFTETVHSEDLPGERDSIPPDWPSQGGMEFKGLSAEYRESEPILNDITLSIKAGEKIGICGRTGSGKTSLIMTLFRMIDISSGTITIDGLDLTSLPRQEIRARLNGVAQSPLLIKGTVRLNAYPLVNSSLGSGTVSDQDILNALKCVNLHSKVVENGGLDADIDDLHLSHGQKQLFCLARAILRPGNVLVLDEATSNVDTKTDEIMQRVIREKFSAHTVLTVAHKLESILDYDKVVVLGDGRIIETGVPYELLAEEGSQFAKLYYAGFNLGVSEFGGWTTSSPGVGGGASGLQGEGRDDIVG